MKIIRTCLLWAICLCLAGNIAIAQIPGWQWAQAGGGGGYQGSTPSNPGWDIINASAFDNEGNLIVGGYVSWTPRFDSIYFPNIIGATNWSGPTFFLAKYNKCGSILWVALGGGPSDDRIFGLDVDEEGNIYTVGALQIAGNTARIISPGKDTTLPGTANTFMNFSKYDKNGTLQYIRTYPRPASGLWSVLNGQFRRLKNGNFLGVVSFGSSTLPSVNIEGYTAYNNERYFAVFDTLGNIVKWSFLDNTPSYSYIGRLVITEDEKIIFPLANGTATNINILGTVFPAQDYKTYLIQTDTNFQVIESNITCDFCDPVFYLSYSNGYLYAVGREPNGAIFDGDTTTVGNPPGGRFTVYKIDSNLHRVWTKRADSQNTSASATTMYSNTNGQYVYIGYQNLGTTVWDSVTVSTPANGSRITLLRMRTSDGVVEGANTAISTLNDQVSSVEVDKQGNAYVLGNFKGSISIPQDTFYAQGNANSPDFFILKWGLPCGDTINSLNPPATATGLVATGTSVSTIDVTWHGLATAPTGYNLYRSPDSISNWQKIATIAGNTTAYTDTGLPPATTRWYKVAAYTTTGGEGSYSNIDSGTTFTPVCSTTVSHSNVDSIYTFTTTNTGPGPYNYQWSYGGINFSTAGQPTLTLATPGTHSVCVTVTDANSCTATACDTITIVAPPPCSASVSHSKLYGFYQFHANATGVAPLTLQWSNNGVNFSTSWTPQLMMSGPGTRVICVTVTDAVGCIATSCDTVTILPCNTTVTSTHVDSLYTFSTAGTTAGPCMYQWTVNGTNFDTVAQPTLVLDSVGSYDVCVTVTDSTGCMATDCQTIGIWVLPTCNTEISYANADSIYSFITADSGQAPYTYKWSNNNNLFSIDAQPTLTLTTPGTYSICITVTDANNCKAYDCDTIVITAPPVCSTGIQYSQAGSTYNFSTVNTSTAPYVYQWKNNNTNFSTAAAPSLTLNTAGSYNVCVTVTDSSGCVSNDCETIVIAGMANQLLREVELYPNPAGDYTQIGIDLATGAIVQLSVYDLSGKQWVKEERQLHSGKNVLVMDLKNLPVGVYTLRVVSGNHNWQGKLTKGE